MRYVIMNRDGYYYVAGIERGFCEWSLQRRLARVFLGDDKANEAMTKIRADGCEGARFVRID